jgi:GR25 family glycosyltransferase involved in LPS biosynthesis
MTIDEQSYKELKQAYKNAVDNNKEVLLFQGYMLLTDYAKYILELLEFHKKEL